ncbi:HLA class II histocompatibility antigen, DR alpha chain-like [Sphaerodactylus townsendi]|uniref:HLA class II histocompatibility antigen, DR alpha chain-like n=1 Tax=Sphaerodactylus townsendi TaxID=933632 RepID=UPI0020274866|nr:HLA class II histocompatibility antigen, DR alpha chain-like [Sphaerodactylus townsendi]
MGGLAGFQWVLLPLLGVYLVASVGSEEVLSQVAFVQRGLRAEKGPDGGGDEFMFDFQGDEIFHVDLGHKETVWRLPQFQTFTSFQAEGAQGNIAVLRSNLQTLMKRSNFTAAENVPPQVTVYPKDPVALGEPNLLVCLADGFSPPVINMTWLKNGEVVKPGEETDFYPKADNSFLEFSYLAFVPDPEGHLLLPEWSTGGLAQPLTKEWSKDHLGPRETPNVPEPLPEAAESVVCRGL